eukprot:CAMPEP_0119013988 /NCGR_PEP_ID=MMETSP1176-20130426/9296_1 /TAXON_ID=265551 /ORGANISM="Synedropsis recta cf, Strain CCMP1620" /LENGTH=199 /DNA_ID=CAMNT_0006967121 /DNA_START=107 /DNA_END=706 /DNA_ORIENTATION=-
MSTSKETKSKDKKKKVAKKSKEDKTPTYAVDTEELTIQASIARVRKKLKDTDQLVPLLFPQGVTCKRSWGFNGSRGATYRSTKKGVRHKMKIKKIEKNKVVITQINSKAARKRAFLPKKQNFVFTLVSTGTGTAETRVKKRVPGYAQPRGFSNKRGKAGKNQRSDVAKFSIQQSGWIHEYLEEKDKKFKHFKKKHKNGS